MKLKDLKKGDTFSPVNNPSLKCVKGSRVVGKSECYDCNSDIGWLKLHGELEVTHIQPYIHRGLTNREFRHLNKVSQPWVYIWTILTNHHQNCK